MGYYFYLRSAANTAQDKPEFDQLAVDYVLQLLISRAF